MFRAAEYCSHHSAVGWSYQNWGVTMNKLIAPVAGLALSAVVAVSVAQARSCSEQGQGCQSWVRTNVPAASQATYIGKCRAEVGRCIARCKGGNKFFVGVYEGAGGGQQYPIDECK